MNERGLNKARIEALSDGVFAIALLLCILTPLLYIIPGEVDRYWHLGQRRS